MPTRSRLWSPGRIIVISITALIALGTFLLSLPVAQHAPIALTDVFFTATSATCVTGLMTVPLDAFTSIGHAIILALMQIGALGMVTLTVFLISLFFELKLSTQLITGQVLDIEQWKRTRGMVGFIIGFTALIEGFGTIAIYQVIKPYYPTAQAWWYALFHAVASLSNAGLTLIEPQFGTMPELPSLLAITAVLVLIGGTGFIVWHEVIEYLRAWYTGKKHFHWTLHTKVVAIMTVALISVPTIVIYALEFLLPQAPVAWYAACGESLFNAICLRSTGFTTLDMQTIHLGTLFCIMIVSFIGSSPGGTGSGIKTTTFALFLATIRAVILKRSVVELKGRSIPNDQLFKALAILLVTLSWIAIAIFFLLISEEGWRFIDIVFETCAACANMGLSTGITPYLSEFGKIIIMITMVIGRIGPLTILLAMRTSKEKVEFHYPEERIVIG